MHFFILPNKWQITEFENLIYSNICWFTAYPTVFFGLDCTNRCDTYCTGNRSCDPAMGICKEGCKKGLSGRMCGLGINKKHACYLILCNTKTNKFVYKNISKKISKIYTIWFRHVQQSTTVWRQQTYCHWHCSGGCNCAYWKCYQFHLLEKKNRYFKWVEFISVKIC